MSPGDIFPSIYLQPKKLIELLTWWLNPLEQPPQKILALDINGKNHNRYLALLQDEGYIAHNVSLQNFIIKEPLKDSFYNLIFSFEWNITDIKEDSQKLEDLFSAIHNQVIKSSSYLILEIKFNSEKNIDELENILTKSGFGSISVLLPAEVGQKKENIVNPFTGVDLTIHNHCWLVALSQQTDEDPAEWLQEYFEN